VFTLNNGVNLTSTGAVSLDRSKPKNAGLVWRTLPGAPYRADSAEIFVLTDPS